MTTWAASQDNPPALHCLLDLVSLANWAAFTPPLVIVLAVAVMNKSTVMRLTVSAFRLGRRALVYLVERAGSIIADRLLEMLIAALIAIMASVPWLADFAAVLERMFH
jgi:hypothetical protein